MQMVTFASVVKFTTFLILNSNEKTVGKHICKQYASSLLHVIW